LTILLTSDSGDIASASSTMTAMYAGLRHGELLALRWEQVDLAQGVTRVECAWYIKEGAIEPKSRAGRRSVPIRPCCATIWTSTNSDPAWADEA